MANALGDLADKVSSDNLAISLSKVVDTSRLKKRIRQLLDAESDEMVKVPLDTGFIQELKFSECIPQLILDLELEKRYAIKKQAGCIKSNLLSIVEVL